MQNRYLDENGKFDAEVVGLTAGQRDAMTFMRDRYHGWKTAEKEFSAADLLPAIASYWSSGLGSTAQAVKNEMAEKFEQRLLDGDIPAANDPAVKPWLDVIKEIVNDKIKEHSRFRNPDHVPAYSFISTNPPLCYYAFFLQQVILDDPAIKAAFEKSPDAQKTLQRYREDVAEVKTYDDFGFTDAQMRNFEKITAVANTLPAPAETKGQPAIPHKPLKM